MNRVGPSDRTGPKIKPAAQPFLKRAWAGLGSLWLGPGFNPSSRIEPKAGHGLHAFWRSLLMWFSFKFFFLIKLKKIQNILNIIVIDYDINFKKKSIL